MRAPYAPLVRRVIGRVDSRACDPLILTARYITPQRFVASERALTPVLCASARNSIHRLFTMQLPLPAWYRSPMTQVVMVGALLLVPSRERLMLIYCMQALHVSVLSACSAPCPILAPVVLRTLRSPICRTVSSTAASPSWVSLLVASRTVSSFYLSPPCSAGNGPRRVLRQIPAALWPRILNLGVPRVPE